MKHAGTQEITTQRLILRRFTMQDAEAMLATWANDPAVAFWMRWLPHGNIETTREYLQTVAESYNNAETYHWAIVRKEDGRLMGSIGILYGQEKNEPPSWMPGYCIGQAFWGRGYTTEALLAAIGYFVEHTGHTALTCTHAVENPASGRVLQKAGFVYSHDGVYEKAPGVEVAAKYYRYNPQSV